MSAARFEGIQVSGLMPGSPAERAGVRPGDRLLIVNGVRMETIDDFLEARAKNPSGVSCTLLRGNAIHEFEWTFQVDERTPLPAPGSA